MGNVTSIPNQRATTVIKEMMMKKDREQLTNESALHNYWRRLFTSLHCHFLPSYNCIQPLCLLISVL
ncbi:hypothetical protein ACJX0J_008765, partial [Zea mays]